MNRIYVPTLGPTDWRRLLADPVNQWEPGKSALEMAVCWEHVRNQPRGIPAEVASALDSIPELAGAELLLGLPEHQVEFEGGGHPSQNDLWALLRVGDAFASLAIEAKAGESLDNLVSVWLAKASGTSRKPERLAALKDRLGIGSADVSGIRYQLLHRTASALKEAVRFRCERAALLVQSFNRTADQTSWEDFKRFGELFHVSVREGAFVRAEAATAVPLYLGWVSSERAGLDRLRAAV